MTKAAKNSCITEFNESDYLILSLFEQHHKACIDSGARHRRSVSGNIEPSPQPCPYLTCNVSFSSDQQKALASFIMLKSLLKLPNQQKKKKKKKSNFQSTAWARHSKPYSVTRVSAHIRVVYINDPITVTGGKCKQDIVISVCITTACLTVWETTSKLLMTCNP